MSLVVPDAGEVLLLHKMLKAALSVDEGYTLKLYKSEVDLTSDTVAADLNAVEADFTSYASKSLTRAGWDTVATSGGAALANYGTTQTWTCGSTGNTIHGYFVLGSTSGTLLWAEEFSR